MSTNLLILKAVGIGMVGVGGISYGLFNLFKTTNIKQDAPSVLNAENDVIAEADIFVLAQGSSINNSTKLNTEPNKRNYRCKLSSNLSQVDKACVIKSITLDKKKISLSELKNLSMSDPIVSSLGAANNYFKVKLSSSIFESLTWNDSQTIDIYGNSDDGQKIGSLKPIFGINKKNIKGKTLYSVGKVSGFKESSNPADATGDKITIENNNTTKCIFIKGDSEVDCSFNKFSSSESHSNFSELDFEEGSEALGEIKKNKYYLFKFTTQQDVEQFKTEAEVKVKLGTPVVGSNSKQIDSVLISNLLPSVMIEHSTNKHLILLGD